MRSRAVRVTLTLLAVVGIGAAAWHCWALQSRITDIDTQAGAFVQARLAASRHASELQSAQQAYVAAGQNQAFWFERVDAASASLRTAVLEMTAATPSASALAELAELTASITEFGERDGRVRSYASAGQKLLAADVIFSDSLDAAGRIHSSIERASDAAALDRSARRRLLGRDQALAAGGAAAGAILVLLLLMPLRAAARTDDADAVVTRAETQVVEAEGLDLRLAPAPIPRLAPQPEIKAAPVEAPDASVAPAVSTEIRPSLELGSIARVCTDLARLDDTSAVPSILERMAVALDAPGLVLWVSDAEGKELVPIAAHGYPASVLSRMKALPITANNATTAAFRTGLLQTVSGEGDTNGAIAAPLVSPAGCLGVMSAEVRSGGEKQADRLAAATIVAAQLATIIGPPAARTEDRSTAAF